MRNANDHLTVCQHTARLFSFEILLEIWMFLSRLSRAFLIFYIWFRRYILSILETGNEKEQTSERDQEMEWAGFALGSLASIYSMRITLKYMKGKYMSEYYILLAKCLWVWHESAASQKKGDK